MNGNRIDQKKTYQAIRRIIATAQPAPIAG